MFPLSTIIWRLNSFVLRIKTAILCKNRADTLARFFMRFYEDEIEMMRPALSYAMAIRSVKRAWPVSFLPAPGPVSVTSPKLSVVTVMAFVAPLIAERG